MHSSLSSSHCQLWPEFTQRLALFASTGTDLYLSALNLGDKSGAQLAIAFKAIPANVTSLHLNRNQLGNKADAELAEAFAAIPANIIYLNLSENDFGIKTGVELALAFQAIPRKPEYGVFREETHIDLKAIL